MKEYSRTELIDIIDEWIIGRNAYRDREVMKDRLIEGRTYESIAERFDMSTAQIKRIVYKRMEKLLPHLK